MQIDSKSLTDFLEQKDAKFIEVQKNWKKIGTVLYNDDEELREFHHDFRACLRTFAFLKTSLEKSFANDPNSERKQQVLDEHLKFMESLREMLLDKLIPLDRS